MNVLSACADPDTDTWTKWLEQALGTSTLRDIRNYDINKG